MPFVPLFFFATSQSSSVIDSAVVRISRAILVHGFSCDVEIITRSALSKDPHSSQLVQVGIAVNDKTTANDQLDKNINNIGSLFLAVLQRITLNAANNAAWPVKVIQWQTPGVSVPGYLHACCQKTLRKISFEKVSGVSVDIFNTEMELVQRHILGQALGVASRGTLMLQGQVQQVHEMSKGRKKVILSPGRGRNRTLVIGDGMDMSSLIGKTIAALVRPIRGKIFLQIVGWSGFQVPLF